MLGGFQARLTSGRVVELSTKKAQALLTYLAIPSGQAHPRDKIAALLWPDALESLARNSLRQTLFTVRRGTASVKPQCLLAEGDTVALNPAAVDVDVASFERLVSEGTTEALEQAVALYQGDFLEGFSLREGPFEEWLMAQRERLWERALEALAKLLARQGEAGAVDQAVQTATRLLTLDPLQEAVHRRLMRLYSQQGRRAAALRQYQVCVGVLQRELGVEPEPETKQLYQDLLRRPPASVPEPEVASPATRRPARSPVSRRAVTDQVPLIGRDRELGIMHDALEGALGGDGQVVALLGEAGIGKSRLSEEICDEARHRGARVLTGASYEAEQTLPFRPWVDALRPAIADAAAMADLPAVWRGELARLFPELGGGGEVRPSQREDYVRLFEALAQLLAHLARERPLVVALEDLQWADETTLRFLSFMAHRLHGTTVLLIGTARSEDVEDVPVLRQLLHALDRESRLVLVALEPLSRDETASLVRLLAPAATPEAALARLADRVWSLCTGNPFVAVETMRAIEGTPPAGARLPLPRKVHDVITAHLARVSEPARQLAAVAAVIGREFEFPLLHRAAGLDERDAAERVEELVRRRILQGVGERFDFTHTRIRSVLHEELLGPRRKLLHGAVAAAIEDFHRDALGPHFAALGGHHREAEAWDRALGYFRRAGDAALAYGGSREAALYYEQALEALRHLPETRETLEQAIDLRFDLRHALLPAADFGRIARAMREAQSIAEALGDRARLGRIHANLANYYWWMGEHREGREACARALAIAGELGDLALHISARHYQAMIHHALGRYREAAELLRENVAALGEDAAEPSGAAALMRVFSGSYLAMCLAELGEFREGEALAERTMAAAEGAGQAFAVGHACVCFASLCLLRGDLDRAIGALERYRQFWIGANFEDPFPIADWFLGYGYLLAGRVEEAVTLLEQVVTPTSSVVGVVGRALWTSWLAEAYLRAGRREDAVFLVAQVSDLAREHDERGHLGWVRRLAGEISAEEPAALPGAEEAYRQALAIAGELGMRPLAAQCHRGLGDLYATAGRAAEARQEFTAARDLLRAMDMKLWLPAVEEALAALR